VNEKFHAIVLVKPVPEMEKVQFDFEKGAIDVSSAPLEINPFDLHAIEAAAQIKEKLGGKVTVISLAPRGAESALRDAIARGADRVILIPEKEKRFPGSDTLTTSYILARAIKKLENFHLIICGEKTADGGSEQVGPGVAEILGIPHIACVSEIREVSKEKLLVVSELGTPYLMELKLPGLITVTKDLNKPRLPTLKDKLKARKAQIEVWNIEDLADVGKPVPPSPLNQAIRISPPPMKKRKGQIFEGEDAVDKLIEALEKEGVLG